jgi:hypothetical protein
MLRLITAHFMPSEPWMDARTASRVSRLAHEGLTLALGCVAAAGIALALYLVAPVALREGVIRAFLGFDQPISSVPVPAHPPLPPSL